VIKILILLIIGLSTGVGIGLFVNSMVVCNTFTGSCWFDSPIINNDYYVFHPEGSDNCETFQSKLDLFHPEGTNPTKFELIDRMKQLECEEK